MIATRADPALPLARLRRAASSSRSAPPTCASRPDEAAAYLNEAMGLDLGPAGDVAALEGAHRGLDRRPPAGGALDAGPR